MMREKETRRRSGARERQGEKVVFDIPPSPDFSHVLIIKNRFIFDTITGKFHRASETASFILSQLKVNAPINEIVVRYTERYGVGRAIAERDVELFLNDMSMVGLPAREASGSLKRSGAARRGSAANGSPQRAVPRAEAPAGARHGRNSTVSAVN
ncbi:PqqD family protein [Labrys monachus]|uniref:PqqD family protein n=1 Tax=Labrys monachus TaxID=217067 RepID=UPI00352267DC